MLQLISSKELTDVFLTKWNIGLITKFCVLLNILSFKIFN